MDPEKHSKEVLIELLQESIEAERLQSIAFEESIEAEFQIQKDMEERGSVYAVGSGVSGQLGQGDTSNVEAFSVIPKTQGAGICAVSTGFDLVFAITEDHDVLVWGGGGWWGLAWARFLKVGDAKTRMAVAWQRPHANRGREYVHNS